MRKWLIVIGMGQDFCRGLADYDQDVDADDVEAFPNHFGRFEFNNPCPPDGPAPVPKTGARFAEMSGDDCDFARGLKWPNPRFTVNGNGTVTNMWQNWSGSKMQSAHFVMLQEEGDYNL